MRVALVGPGNTPIPPTGWGAMERGIWAHHQHSLDAGYESIIVNARRAREIYGACLRTEPDIIHLHADWRLGHCLPYLLKRPTPLVVTSHDYRVGRSIPTHLAPTLAAADSVIALSPSIERNLRDIRDDGIWYIPNGVDTETFRPLVKKPNTVAAIGNNTARKRFAEIARFFLARPDYSLTLCGPGMCAGPGGERPVVPTGPNIVRLENESHDAVARLLGESEYYVHLAVMEASSLALREAMAAGCRVWTTPENAQDLTNVAFSWEDAIADPDLGRRAAREAESFDWSVIVNKHAEVYAETLARWRAATTSAARARARYAAVAVRTGALNARRNLRRALAHAISNR